MPFYQFSAVNSQGLQMQGTVQAGSLDEANRALAQQGYRVTDLRDTAQAVAAPPPSLRTEPRPPAPRPVASPAPSPVRVNTPAPKPKRQPVKTRWTKDKDIYFLFSQLSSYFKSGINPAQAFNDLGSRTPRADVRQAFQEVSANVTEGGSIADTLERYPYLFAPHVVGTVRAGEVGGYLPEALMAISDHADSSRKFRRWFVMLGWAVVGVLICIPLGKGFIDGAVMTWDAQEKAGGMAPGGATLMQEVWKSFKVVGPIALLITAVMIVAGFVWQSMRFRVLRHRLVLRAPAAMKRAKAESFSAFSWHLGNLSKAGLPPLRAWELASDTAPNLAIQESLREQAVRMNEQTKLSEALYNTKLFPHEYGAMVQTGEVTGDVPGQLMYVTRMSQEELGIQDKLSKTRVGCWIVLVTFGLGTLVIYSLYGSFWRNLIPKILGE